MLSCGSVQERINTPWEAYSCGGVWKRINPMRVLYIIRMHSLTPTPEYKHICCSTLDPNVRHRHVPSTRPARAQHAPIPGKEASAFLVDFAHVGETQLWREGIQRVRQLRAQGERSEEACHLDNLHYLHIHLYDNCKYTYNNNTHKFVSHLRSRTRSAVLAIHI